jgi:hypothetical protein
MRLEMEGRDGLNLLVWSMAVEARRVVGEGNGGGRDRVDSNGGSNANAIAQIYGLR